MSRYFESCLPDAERLALRRFNKAPGGRVFFASLESILNSLRPVFEIAERNQFADSFRRSVFTHSFAQSMEARCLVLDELQWRVKFGDSARLEDCVKEVISEIAQRGFASITQYLVESDDGTQTMRCSPNSLSIGMQQAVA